MKLNNYPLSRKENIVVQESEKEVLLYDLNENKAFCLNETSAIVWELCDGKSPISEINQKLSKKLNQNSSEDLVWLALDQLKKENLLTNADEVNVDFNGMSRREVIRKVGFASLIALPMITAITSPVAAASASCLLFSPPPSCIVLIPAANCVANVTDATFQSARGGGGCNDHCLCLAPTGSNCSGIQAAGTCA